MLVHVRECLERGGRRAEHHRYLESLGARDRQIARLVAESFLLTVGRVVFFVDDDETELRHRREHR